MRSHCGQQTYGGEEWPLELVLAEEVHRVLAVISVDLLVREHRDLPAGAVYEHSLALAMHLRKVGRELPAILCIDDEDHRMASLP